MGGAGVFKGSCWMPHFAKLYVVAGFSLFQGEATVSSCPTHSLPGSLLRKSAAR